MSTTHGIKLDAATLERLKRLGALRKRSPHWLMKEAIESYLEREERYEQEKLEDMERWEQYCLTGHAVSQSEATKWLTFLAEGRVSPCPK